MRDRSRAQNRAAAKHIHMIVIAAIWLGVAITLLMIPALPALAATTVRTITTLEDFNDGIFSHTGATVQVINGDDGNGGSTTLYQKVIPSPMSMRERTRDSESRMNSRWFYADCESAFLTLAFSFQRTPAEFKRKPKPTPPHWSQAKSASRLNARTMVPHSAPPAMRIGLFSE